jgi:hypothetical protein
MSVPTGLPAPAMNRTAAGFADAASDVVAADILVTVGDYTGGAAEDMFTLAAHGLGTGDHVFLLHKIAAGAVTGVVGTRFKVKVLSSSTFQLTDLDGTIIENTADGASVVFLKGSHRTPDSVVQNVILPRLIVADGDFTGGAVELDFVPRADTGLHGLEDTNTLKLLYKAAAGTVLGTAVNTTVYAKSMTAAVFCVAATSGGNALGNSADGLAIFIKTS